jgi:hypothetical protein
MPVIEEVHADPLCAATSCSAPFSHTTKRGAASAGRFRKEAAQS